ncbi:MAG: hypothetical protein MUO42_06570, partial [Anaerolineaceae bacterium]|nr:hypothetical protein [Anaerolineaceae bacterium]
MSKNLKLLKRITCILALAFLVMGMVPLPVVSKIASSPKLQGLPELQFTLDKKGKDKTCPNSSRHHSCSATRWARIPPLGPDHRLRVACNLLSHRSHHQLYRHHNRIRSGMLRPLLVCILRHHRHRPRRRQPHTPSRLCNRHLS